MNLSSWNNESIRYMRSAAEKTDFYKKAAGIIAPALTKNSSLLDAGSGIGSLALALSGYAGMITAVENSRDASAVLETEIQNRRITNIKALCCDVFSLSGNYVFDDAVFCYFGTPAEICEVVRKHCRGSVFIIKRYKTGLRFRESGHASHLDTLSSCRDYFQERNVPFLEYSICSEMGQPFMNLEDARRFFVMQNNGKDVFSSDSMLLDFLVHTDDAQHPFYYPVMKEAGCLQIRAEDIYDVHI